MQEQTHHAKSVANKCPLTAIWVYIHKACVKPSFSSLLKAVATHQSPRAAALRSPKQLEEPRELLQQPNHPQGAEQRHSQLSGRVALVSGAFSELHHRHTGCKPAMTTPFGKLSAKGGCVPLATINGLRAVHLRLPMSVLAAGMV